jgi:N-acyl-D-aspartate/D-glutamate deacylase
LPHDRDVRRRSALKRRAPVQCRLASTRPAQRFGLKDRGLLREGLAADLVLFDADRLADRADYGEPCLPAAGLQAVWVNGELALQAGQAGARAGRVLASRH